MHCRTVTIVVLNPGFERVSNKSETLKESEHKLLTVISATKMHLSQSQTSNNRYIITDLLYLLLNIAYGFVLFFLLENCILNIIISILTVFCNVWWEPAMLTAKLLSGVHNLNLPHGFVSFDRCNKIELFTYHYSHKNNYAKYCYSSSYVHNSKNNQNF